MCGCRSLFKIATFRVEIIIIEIVIYCGIILLNINIWRRRDEKI